jgi:catechol 2,3-dioxygenase
MATDSLPATAAVGRVALTVTDIAAVADFYESVVGLDIVSEGDDRVVLGAGDRPLLVLERDPEAPERPREAAGLFHTAFRVPNRAALADALARVESEWTLAGASDHRVSEALYLWDPEDNGVEIYCDRPREEWPTENDRVQMDTLPLDREALGEAAAGADGVPAGTDVGHVHLEVTSLEDARPFYVDALGLGVRQEYNGALFVAAGDYHHHVGLNTWNGRSDPTSGRGLAWVELTVPDDDALAATRERLVGAGVAVTDTDDGIAVSDPDGIRVRVVVASD